MKARIDLYQKTGAVQQQTFIVKEDTYIVLDREMLDLYSLKFTVLEEDPPSTVPQPVTWHSCWCGTVHAAAYDDGYACD